MYDSLPYYYNMYYVVQYVTCVRHISIATIYTLSNHSLIYIYTLSPYLSIGTARTTTSTKVDCIGQVHVNLFNYKHELNYSNATAVYEDRELYAMYGKICICMYIYIDIYITESCM